MSHSNRLRLSEVRRVFRLLSDARDLRYDSEAQQRLLADGLVRCIGGRNAFSVRFEHFLPGHVPIPTQLVFSGTTDPRLIDYMGEWSQGHGTLDDPMVVHTLRMSGEVHAATRVQMMTDHEYQRYPIYDQVLERCHVYDILVSFYRCGPGRIRGYALQRRVTRRPFSERERRMMHLFISEMRRLDRAAKLEVTPPDDGRLTHRQQQLVARLVKGRSPQQIATELGLSVMTVRTYLRDLYRRMDVRGRDELIARLLTSNSSAAWPHDRNHTKRGDLE